jgi:hypothetical protein
MWTGCIGWNPFEALSRLHLEPMSADVMGPKRIVAKVRAVDPEDKLRKHWDAPVSITSQHYSTAA